MPLLIECGWQEIADEVWLVTAPMEERVQPHNGQGRVKRSGGKAAHCLPDERRRKKPFADVIIDNSGDIERLYEMTDRLYRQALEKDGSNQRQTGGAEKKPKKKKRRKSANIKWGRAICLGLCALVVLSALAWQLSWLLEKAGI